VVRRYGKGSIVTRFVTRHGAFVVGALVATSGCAARGAATTPVVAVLAPCAAPAGADADERPPSDGPPAAAYAPPPEPVVADAGRSVGDATVWIDAGDEEAQVGETRTIVVGILAGRGYRITELFPHRVRVAAAVDGVELLAAEVRREDGVLVNERTFEMPVPLKALRPGEYVIPFDVKTSTCTDVICYVVERQVTVRLTARLGAPGGTR
jgi:hypothetical protein